MDLDNKTMILLAVALGCSAPGQADTQADTVVAYQRHIKDLESNQGIYGAQLGEPLMGLGLAYQIENDHERAAATFKRALQIKRINNGLYDLDQVPILDQLIKSNIAKQNWMDVDGNYQRMLWLHRRNYEGDDPGLLTALDRVGRWKLNAHRHRLLKDREEYLLRDADRIYRETIAAVSARNATDPRLIGLLYGQALANYPIIPNKVGRILQRVITIYETNPELPKLGHANALIHLGDWRLLRGWQDGAHQTYRDAHALLASDAANREHLASLFGAPRIIPDVKMVLPELDEYRNSRAEREYVLALLDVSEHGRPGNIKILELSLPDGRGNDRTAKKVVKSRHYRPRYQNGEPVATVEHQVHIVRGD